MAQKEDEEDRVYRKKEKEEKRGSFTNQIDPHPFIYCSSDIPSLVTNSGDSVKFEL